MNPNTFEEGKVGLGGGGEQILGKSRLYNEEGSEEWMHPRGWGRGRKWRRAGGGDGGRGGEVHACYLPPSYTLEYSRYQL